MILAIIIATLSLLIVPSLVLGADTPIQISPVDNSTITQLKPKLTWQYSGNCPIDTKISCFRVELDTSLLFPNPKYNYTNSFSYSPQTLTDGRWYWRVKAKDASETWSSWSTVWSFTLQTSISTPTPSSSSSPTSAPSPSSTPQSTSSFTISSIPSQINSDQSFNVSVNLTLPNNHNTDYYLSGAFKKTDGTRYFGLTKISSNWVKYESSNYLNQYKITTDESGNWAGILEVKPDTSDSDYKGSGDYVFKVGRYTTSGSGPTWSNNESTIQIISTESDNQSSAPINNPSSTTNSPTSSQPSKTKTTTSNQTKSYDRLVYHIASIAGATASATTSASSTLSAVKKQKQTNPIIWVGLIFIFAGSGAIGYIYLKKNAKIHIPFSK